MSDKNVWWSGKLPSIEDMTAGGATSMPGFLGIEFTDVGPAHVTARMPVSDRTRQPFGRIHGGASVVLAETVGSVAASFALDRSKFVAVGMEINANHVRPAYDGYVHATATPENIGRTTQIWSIRITDDAGKLVCISRITMAVIPRDRGIKN
ncbi:MAG: hotdog fold thioesterase [Alphaproteobacteria bacterium]|nr:MAG: hotdog fold thioesterase [Alphaproteobacteria bacterium]